MSALYDQLGNKDSWLVKEALGRRCEVCRAKPGEECTNTMLNGVPLSGRLVHFARTCA